MNLLIPTNFVTTQHFLADEEATKAYAKTFAKQCNPGMVIYLQGELGAGKTTFIRGLLRGLGYIGRVKSPTFTLVEPYPLDELTVYHFDLYRLTDPQELYYLGFKDYLREDSLLLIEWPEKAGNILPPAQVVLRLCIPDNGQGRELELSHCHLERSE